MEKQELLAKVIENVDDYTKDDLSAFIITLILRSDKFENNIENGYLFLEDIIKHYYNIYDQLLGQTGAPEFIDFKETIRKTRKEDWYS